MAPRDPAPRAAGQLFDHPADLAPTPHPGDLHRQARGHTDGVPQAHAIDRRPKRVHVAISRVGEDAVDLNARRPHLRTCAKPIRHLG
jgi:hypothetical protein